MGRRKVRKEAEEAQTLADEIGENGEEGGGKGTGFFACYLLTSLCPRFKGHTYIGYTLNPRRRIRQHNGEIGSGAWRTKRKRPWEMVLCIYGFPTNIAALQFEWAWQHPVESLAVRNAATSFKSLSGLANKIKLAYTMLSLPTWQSLNLTVNLFSTKYQKYTSACPALPDQMCTQIGSMDELPCYNVNACVNDESDDTEFQEKESTEAAMEAHDSPGFVYSHEEDVDQQFNYGDDAGTESSECLASTQVGWPRNSLPIREEDRGQSSSIMYNSPAKPFANSYVFEDPESPRSVELTTELDGPPNKRSTTVSVGNEDQPYSRSPVISHCDVVEIIDIFTPSPHCPINSGMKKRRLLDMSPEIIDLTNSPMYV